jgi:hypothetical protein
MADLNVAVIGLLGVMAGGYFNNFLAEDFRRFRDGQALAGALAGELESHGDAAAQIKKSLALLIDNSDVPIAAVKFPELPIANSPIFEANTGKVGLLDPESAKDVAYVYERIRSFRVNLSLLSKHHVEFGPGWRTSMVSGCVEAIEQAEDRGKPLVERLKLHAKASYWRRPATVKQCVAGIIVVAVLVVVAIRLSGPTTSTNCTTVFDHANGVLSTV